MTRSFLKGVLKVDLFATDLFFTCFFFLFVCKKILLTIMSKIWNWHFIAPDFRVVKKCSWHINLIFTLIFLWITNMFCKILRHSDWNFEASLDFLKLFCHNITNNNAAILKLNLRLSLSCFLRLLTPCAESDIHFEQECLFFLVA